MNVMKFENDRWVEAPAMELDIEDLIYFKKNIHEVMSKPTILKNGKVYFNTIQDKRKDESIALAIGEKWKNRQATIAVMDYTNSACRDFGDETYMIAELEQGPGAIYSPRLSLEELEEWCENNLYHFENFFEKNEVSLDKGDIVKIEPWWLS